MVIIKLHMSIVPWGGVDKTPVFDGAAGGFVYVYGGTHLKSSGRPFLTVSEMTAFGPG